MSTGYVVPEELAVIAAAMVAEEATRCLWENISPQGQAQWLSRMRDALAAVLPLALAAERERCARVADAKADEYETAYRAGLKSSQYIQGMSDGASEIADAIRGDAT